MAILIAVVGKSGSGKTSSIRNLDPKTTYYYNCDEKTLPFPDALKLYNEENRNYNATKNLKMPSENATADVKKKSIPWSLINVINKSPAKVIVFDTLNALMVDDVMNRMKEKGFDKWIDLATIIYDFVRDCNKIETNKILVFMFHEESFLDDDGIRTRRILTSGRKLSQIQLETMFPIVLFSNAKGDGYNNEYVFETRARSSTAKTPLGMFSDFEIPNDLDYVVKRVNEYYDIKQPKIKEEKSNGKGSSNQHAGDSTEQVGAITEAN
jgi:hypothetical protein